MHKMLLDIPQRLETERLYLRCYEPGDGPWYYEMIKINRTHLERYESDNAAMSIETGDDAEVLVREFAAGWAARSYFFMGVFDKLNDRFVAQLYIGPSNWDLPEFEVGFFADRDNEGKGYVTEALKGALGFIFKHLRAKRIILHTDETNLRSIGVAERCGFVKEGLLRQNRKRPDGTFSNNLCYGLMESEFNV